MKAITNILIFYFLTFTTIISYANDGVTLFNPQTDKISTLVDVEAGIETELQFKGYWMCSSINTIKNKCILVTYYLKNEGFNEKDAKMLTIIQVRLPPNYEKIIDEETLDYTDVVGGMKNYEQLGIYIGQHIANRIKYAKLKKVS